VLFSHQTKVLLYSQLSNKSVGAKQSSNAISPTIYHVSLSRMGALKWLLQLSKFTPVIYMPFCHWTKASIEFVIEWIQSTTHVLFSHWTGALKLNRPLCHYQVTIYPPSVIARRHTNTNRSDLFDRSTASASSVYERACRSNLSSIRVLCYRTRASKYKLLIESILTYIEVLSVIEQEQQNTNQSLDSFVHSVYAPSVIKRMH